MLSSRTRYGSQNATSAYKQTCMSDLNEVRTEGLQREYHMGRKLMRRNLINDKFSSVLRTFVRTKGNLYAIIAVIAKRFSFILTEKSRDKCFGVGAASKTCVLKLFFLYVDYPLPLMLDTTWTSCGTLLCKDDTVY